MISKERIQNYVFHYRSRYKYMVESDHIVDRANAEACRIATTSWRTISHQCFNTEYPDFKIEEVLEGIKIEWDEYLKTGIPRLEMVDPDPLRDLMASIRKDFPGRFPQIQEIAKPVDPSPPQKTISPAIEQEPEFDPQTGQRRRRRRSAEQSVNLANQAQGEPESNPSQSQATPELAIPVVNVNREFLDNVNPRSIDEVVNVIRHEFDLDNEDMEHLNRAALVPNMIPLLS